MPRRTAKLGVEETAALVYASVSVARLLTEVIPKEVLGRVLLDECEAGSFLSPADDIRMPFVVDLCPFVEHVLFDTATYPLRFFKYVCTAMPNLTSISIRSKSGIVSGHTFSHMAKLSETLEAIDCTELVAVVPEAGRYFSQFKQLRRLGYRCVNPGEDIPMLRAELPLLQRLDAPLLNLTERFGTGAETDSAGTEASDCPITAGFTDLRRLKVSLSLPGRAAQPPRCLQSLSSLTALELTLHLCDIGEPSAPTPSFWIKLCRQMPRLVSLTLAAEWSGDLSPLMVGLRLFCPRLQHLKIHHYYFQEGAQYGLIGLLADAAPWNALQKSTGVPTNDVIEWLGDDCGGVVPVPDRRPGAAAVEEWFNNAPPIELRSLTIFNTSCDVRHRRGFEAQRIIDGFASLLMARSSRRLTAIHLGKDASSWYLVLPIARLLAAIPFAHCLKLVDLGGVCIEGATYFEVAVAVSDSTHPLNPNATARIEQLNLFSPGIHSTVPDTTLSARRTWLAMLSQNAHRAASRDSGSSGADHHTVPPAGGDGGAEDAAAASCSLSSTAEAMVQAGGFPIMSQSMRRIQASGDCAEDADFRSMIAGCPKLEVIGVACTGADPSHLVPPGRALEIVRSGFVVSGCGEGY